MTGTSGLPSSLYCYISPTNELSIAIDGLGYLVLLGIGYFSMISNLGGVDDAVVFLSILIKLC
jgi:hypothetical protein